MHGLGVSFSQRQDRKVREVFISCAEQHTENTATKPEITAA